jgi:predicted 3-demethylubiquinone-9 3-methyltransferase (glyoxalase superfamily)
MPGKHRRRVGPATIAVRSITPFLWYGDDALPAAKFYTSIFRGSRIVQVSLDPAKAGRRSAPVMSVTFDLAGQRVMALNGGPAFRPTPAFSLFVRCRGQREVDQVWDRLIRGGKPSQCGWLVDKFGVSWQVIPDRLMELLSDPARSGRAVGAMLKMVKIDVAELERAVGDG